MKCSHGKSGLGEPSYFYLFVVFTLNGVMVMFFFFLCYHVRYVTMTTVCFIIVHGVYIVIAFWVQHLVPYNFFIITLRLVLFIIFPILRFFCQGYKGTMDTSIKGKLCFSIFNFTTICINCYIAVSF